MLALRNLAQLHDPSDPDPWLALRLDTSFPLDPGARDDLVATMSSGSRQFLLPLIRPLARAAIVLIQVIRLVIPRGLASTHLLHWLIAKGLACFVRPDANRLILRHFHIGSDIAEFIADNSPVKIETTPLRPRTLDDVREGIFVQHDVNLFNLIIRLNAALQEKGLALEQRALEDLDFSAIHASPALEEMPSGILNRIDLASAIELYTPIYQLLLNDRDFWRASNSLQLDETIALYVCQIIGDWRRLGLVNNRHPLIPESTLRAGHRLLLHGLGAESLHAALLQLKRQQARGTRPEPQRRRLARKAKPSLEIAIQQERHATAR